MTKKPIIFETRHTPKFYEIDQFSHLSTVHYPRYFIDHRLEGMSKFIGLDTKKIICAPVLFYVIHIELDLIKPVLMDQEFTIKSFVSKVGEKTCDVQCDMLSEKAVQLSKCQMSCICVDSQTKKPCPWPQDYIDQFFEISS